MIWEIIDNQRTAAQRKCIVANQVTEFYRSTVFLSSAVFYFSGVSLRIIIILISTFICYICSVTLTLSYMKKFITYYQYNNHCFQSSIHEKNIQTFSHRLQYCNTGSMWSWLPNIMVYREPARWRHHNYEIWQLWDFQCVYSKWRHRMHIPRNLAGRCAILQNWEKFIIRHLDYFEYQLRYTVFVPPRTSLQAISERGSCHEYAFLGHGQLDLQFKR